MRLFIITLLILLSGCSTFFPDSSLDYLEAQESPETQTPEGITLLTQDRYPIPEVVGQENLSEEFVVPVPDPLVVESSDQDKVASLSDFRSFEINPRLEKDGAGTEILRLSTNFAVSWAKVTEALTASKIRVSDLNRSIGIYYLDLPNPEAINDQRSWWSKLWTSPPELAVTYLLKMNRAGDGVYLSLLKDSESLAEESLTHDVLETLRQQLAQ